MPPEPSSFLILRASFLCALCLLAVLAVLGRTRWGSGLVRRSATPDLTVQGCGWVDVALLLMLILMVGLPYLSPPPAVAPSDPAKDGGGVTVPAVVAASMLQLLGAVCLVLYLRLIRGVNPVSALGLGRLRMGAILKFGSITAIIVFFAAQLMNWVMYQFLMGEAPPTETDQPLVQVFKNADQSSLRLAIFLMCGVLIPVTEELLYRGFIYGITKYLAGPWPAMVFSAILFSLAHQNLMAAVPLFALGLGFAFSYERTRCLWVPILAHALFNTWNLIALIWSTT